MQNDSTQPTSDIILRSSDGKTFYTWKSILSISSTVFCDMFTLPQPITETSDGTQVHEDGRLVVDLPEDSNILQHILSICHSASLTGKEFRIESMPVPALPAVLEAATKYGMGNLHNAVVAELGNPVFLREDPAIVYALACRYERREAALLAAKHTLVLPSLRTYEHEFTDRSLSCLLMYREECVTTARSLADDHTWIVYHSRVAPLFGCDNDGRCMGYTTIRDSPSRTYSRGREEEMSVHTWWLDYMRKAGNALSRMPFSDTVKDPKLVGDAQRKIASLKCTECGPREVQEAFQLFVDDFAAEVEQRVGEVEINLGF